MMIARLMAIAAALLMPLSAPVVAKERTAADEQFRQYAFSMCRMRESNLVWVEIDYKKRTFKCHPDNDKHN